ncbi:MAG TPA: hypothetical protein VMB82_01955 [Acidimicrobiales bacterium]|nr:hypothetical protein [Acidimicrobiales bacterium]
MEGGETGKVLEHDAIVEFTALLQESTRQRQQLLELLRRMRRAGGAPPGRRTGSPQAQRTTPTATRAGGLPPPPPTVAPGPLAPWADDVLPPMPNRPGQDYDYFQSLDERLRMLTPGGPGSGTPREERQLPG